MDGNDNDMIKNAFTIIAFVFLCSLFFVGFLIYHSIVIHAFISAKHIIFVAPFFVSSFKTLLQIYLWPSILSIISLIIGVYLQYTYKKKHRPLIFLSSVVLLDCIVCLFIWFYFPHYNYKGFQACVRLQSSDQVSYSEFLQKYGKPTREYPGRIEYIDIHNGSEESCVLNIGDQGIIFSKYRSFIVY